MAAALGVILLWVGRVLLAHFIVRILVGAGLAFVTYHYAVGPLMAQVQSLMGTSSSVAVQWLGFLNVDKAFSIIFSAYTIRMALKTMHLVKS